MNTPLLIDVQRLSGRPQSAHLLFSGIFKSLLEADMYELNEEFGSLWSLRDRCSTIQITIIYTCLMEVSCIVK